MIHRARLIYILLAFQFILANSIQLEHSIIPKINCQDINNNGKLDFMATNNSVAPRTIFWMELENDTTKQIWHYSMPKDVVGYFSDMILGDFDNDGISELISLAYKENSSNIFYVFTLDSLKTQFSIPNILSINNLKSKIISPQSIHSLSMMENKMTPFLLIQGSPSRNIIMCEYSNFQINEIGSIGKKFLNQSIGPLSIVTGKFNDDVIEDIFILSNGRKPKGYFVFSDGTEKKINLKNYPHLSLINKNGIDINGNGIDDILMLDEKGNLMSNIWENQSIALLDSNINSISFKMDDGLIHVTTINENGIIGQLIVDPLTMSLITSNFIVSQFNDTDSLKINSIIDNNDILMISEEEKSRIISHMLNNDVSSINYKKELINEDERKKIYDKPADFIIQLGQEFTHSISTDTAKSFLNFIGNRLPLGMEFDLNDINLKWTPTENDLGYHELSYSLEVREKGDLEMAMQDDIQSVSQKENIIGGDFSYLIYVNYPVQFIEKEKQIKIVNKEFHEEFIEIQDFNDDVNYELKILEDDKDAKFMLKDSNEMQDSVKQIFLLEADSTKDNFNINAIFSWLPNTKMNSETFKLLVSDGYGTDTLDLIINIHPEINLSDNITDYEFTVGESIMIPIKVQQLKQSENYEYELLNAPENMWINDEGIIHWIPLQTQIDNHIIEVSVSDGFASSTFLLHININAIPVISSRPPENFYLNLDDSLSFSLESFDMNMKPTLNWKLISGPEKMILNSEGILKWKGDQLDYHSYEIQLSDGIDSVMWKGSIYVNDIPLIVSKPTLIVTVDSTYEYLIKVKDDNLMSSINSSLKNNINYELILGPEGMKIEENKIFWEADSFGFYDIKIKVNDGMDEAIQEFQIKANSLPVFSSKDSVLTMFGDTLKFVFSADDLNMDDSLTYIIDDKKAEMNLNQISGLLSWFPLKENMGINEFNVKALDGNPNSETVQSFKVFVYDLPTFTGDLLTEAFVGLEFSGFLNGRDMHEEKIRDDAVIIEKTTMTDYALSQYGRFLQWVPTKEDIGKQEIKIKIIDKFGFANYHTHHFTVFNNPCHQCKDGSSDSPVDTTIIK